MTLPRLFGVIAMLVVMALPGKPARAQSTDRMDFIGVSIDSATSRADRRWTPSFEPSAAVNL